MKFWSILIVSSLLVATSSGCLFHRHKHQKPIPIADQTEATFQQRWVAKRMGELQAGGVSDAREARRQALDEFRKKFPYTAISQKPDPEMGGSH